MPQTIHYTKELNEQQLKAVQSTEGPFLVIAGAGSGKTRVLTFRTAYLVEQGIDPENILLLTFTRRASTEMLERASNILDDRCRKVSGGTFHSFANMILRKYADRAGLAKNFTILDQSDSESLIARIRKEKKLTDLDKKFPRKGTLFDIISKSVNKDTDIAAVIYDEYPQFSTWIDIIEDVKKEYKTRKLAMSVLDFDDLLLRLENLLETKQDLRASLSEYYRYIMVDEYQDTNRVQARIIKLLCEVHDNVMAVGDDSQSIYSFRGANFKNIMDFPKIFKKATVITLEENYRSSQPILDLTNEVITSAKEGFNKVLFTNKKGSALPVYRDLDNENAQSKYIIQNILQLKEDGIEWKDIAVLFRSGWHSNDLEIELTRIGIPFVKYGGQKFVESAHMKDILAVLRLIINPLDAISWMRVLTLMPKIGPQTAVRIANEAAASMRQGEITLSEKSLKNNTVRKFTAFLNGIRAQDISPREILDFALEEYAPLLVENYDDHDRRANDLESLQTIISRYQDLNHFLTDISLEPPEASHVHARRKHMDNNALCLSTIHSAKGLEWHTVFLIHLSEGFLPSYRSFNSLDAIEEERRLFYVASTRAKDNLFLLRPLMNSSPRAKQPGIDSQYTRTSRFLGEGRILKLLDIQQRQEMSQSHYNNYSSSHDDPYKDDYKQHDPYLSAW